MEVVQSIEALLEAGFRELRLQELKKRSCTIDCGLDILPQPPIPDMLQHASDIIHTDRRTCCSTPVILFIQIGASQVGNWPHSFQSAMEVQWQLLTLSDVRRYVQDGFLEVSQLSKDGKGTSSVLNFWSVLLWRERPFCPGSSLVTKPRITFMSRSQWSGITRNHQEKRSSR
jgi:hypothetical protein